MQVDDNEIGFQRQWAIFFCFVQELLACGEGYHRIPKVMMKKIILLRV